MNTNYIESLKAAAQDALKRGVQLEKPITFYSTTASLAIGITIGSLMRDAGSGAPIRIGEKIVEFNAMGNGVKRPDGYIQRYGYYNTADPEVVLKLVERAEKPDTDILLSEDYLKAVTPPDIQINTLETRVVTAENELERLIAENKRLEEENRRAQAALAAAETAPGRKSAKAGE